MIKIHAILQLLCIKYMSVWNESLDRGDSLNVFPLCRSFQGSCRDSPWCIFPADKVRGRSLCEPCRSSPLSGRAPPSARRSPWSSSSPLPSSPSSCSCRSSPLGKKMMPIIRCLRKVQTLVLDLKLRKYLLFFVELKMFLVMDINVSGFTSSSMTLRFWFWKYKIIIFCSEDKDMQ